MVAMGGLIDQHKVLETWFHLTAEGLQNTLRRNLQ